ncbi:MAG: hypothetical protein Kow0010_23470 [Dehalococcoidia bacterium]
MDDALVLNLTGEQAEALHAVLERALDETRSGYGHASGASRALIEKEQEVPALLVVQVHGLRGHGH